MSSDVEVEEHSRLPAQGQISFGQAFLAGGLAGAMAKTTIAPLDRVKILYQIDTKKVFSLTNAWRELGDIAYREGVGALWRGNGAMLLRVVPYAAIQFGSFEGLKSIWSTFNNRRPNEQTPSSRFVIGAVAGTISVFATYPLDLMRAKLAAQRGTSFTFFIIIVRAQGYLQLMKSTFDAEGARGLYRGFSATVIGIVPYAGTSYCIFETLKASVLARTGEESLSSQARLQSGAIAGLVAQSATYPLDIIRRRMQVHGHVRSKEGERILGVWNSLKNVYRSEGLRQGLYKGLVMNWIKGPIATAISFTVYDTLKTEFLRYSSRSRDKP